MSDVERPSSGREQPGKPGQSVPARNMADIARMFLDGARPLDAARNAMRRLPPAGAQPSTEKRQPEKNQPEIGADAPPAPSQSVAHTLLGLASAPHQTAAWKLLARAAQGIADDQSTTVGIIGLLPSGGGWNCVVDIVGVDSAEELPQFRLPTQGMGGADMQVARAIHALRPAVGIWIIAAPTPESRAFPAIAGIMGEWLLACATDNDGLVAGYQHLKAAWKRCGKKAGIAPSAYLFSDDYAHAALVHKRLRKAAQEFLKTDLALAGAGPIRPSHEPIRAFSLSMSGPEDSLWAAILDELCPIGEAPETQAKTDIEAALEDVEGHADEMARQSLKASAMAMDHLAQVLDPEERAALSAAFEEPGVPVAVAGSIESPITPAFESPQEIPHVVVLKAPAPQPKPPAPAQKMPARVENPSAEQRARQPIAHKNIADEKAGTSLRAFDLEECKDRATQWEAVERSIWDLSPRSALLEARPPMSWASETCISIDGEGRVNVWTLYKDGASWFALREWANEHRNLLALTRRDLAISKDTEVAVHIVMPLEEATESGDSGKATAVISTMMRTPSKSVHLYRLRTVQWDNRRGLVVVPMA